jgi:hypothetical protein
VVVSADAADVSLELASEEHPVRAPVIIAVVIAIANNLFLFNIPFPPFKTTF